MRTLRLRLGQHRRPLAFCLALAGLWITVRAAAPPSPATVPVLVAARDLPAGRALTSDDVRPARWPMDRAPGGRLTSVAGRALASPVRRGELLTDTRVVGPGLLAGQAAGTVAMPVRLADPAASALLHAGDRVDVLASAGSAPSAPAYSLQPDTDSLRSDTDSFQPDLPDVTEPRASNPAADDDVGSAGDSGSEAGSSGAVRVATAALVLAVAGEATSEPGDSGFSGGGLSGLTGGALSGAGSASTSAAGLLVLAVTSREAGRLAVLQSSSYLGVALLPRQP